MKKTSKNANGSVDIYLRTASSSRPGEQLDHDRQWGPLVRHLPSVWSWQAILRQDLADAGHRTNLEV